MNLKLPMKRTGFHITFALATMLGGDICSANPITYNVNQTIGGGGVIGTIQTDGTTGVLATINITAWNLDLNGVGASFNITDANSMVAVVGNDVTATATDLLFDFSGPAGDYLLFEQVLFLGAHYYCDATTNGTCFQGASVAPEAFSDPSFQNVSVSGNQVIATIPEPAALALFGAGLVGLGLMRRQKSV
ncbi:MAG TPA: PEP-CTERM sorting domain-containing protein [Acetobacteraceae bacterium]|nr:PEP-CTERM sorting domain-containing protein [Acetobacteraceae bacterium]